MRKQAWQTVKFTLYDYPYYDQYIRDVREELLRSIPDTNVGGTQTHNPHAQEDKIIRIADDTRIRSIERQQKAVKRALSSSPDWVCRLIHYMYFDGNRYPLNQASELVGYDRRTAKKYHDLFCESLADNLGLIKDGKR